MEIRHRRRFHLALFDQDAQRAVSVACNFAGDAS